MIWGERIKLRRLELGDIEKMASWKMNEDPLFSDYNFPLFTPAEQKLWFARKNQHGKRCYCILNRENRIIGYIALRKLNYLDKSGEIGIVMDPAYHNMGFGTEAISVFLKWYFTEFRFSRLNLIVASYNKRAIICYEKIGFRVTKTYYGKFYNDEFDPFDGKSEELEKYFISTPYGTQTEYMKMSIKKDEFIQDSKIDG